MEGTGKGADEAAGHLADLGHDIFFDDGLGHGGSDFGNSRFHIRLDGNKDAEALDGGISRLLNGIDRQRDAVIAGGQHREESLHRLAEDLLVDAGKDVGRDEMLLGERRDERLRRVSGEIGRRVGCGVGHVDGAKAGVGIGVFGNVLVEELLGQRRQDIGEVLFGRAVVGRDGGRDALHIRGHHVLDILLGDADAKGR